MLSSLGIRNYIMWTEVLVFILTLTIACQLCLFKNIIRDTIMYYHFFQIKPNVLSLPVKLTRIRVDHLKIWNCNVINWHCCDPLIITFELTSIKWENTPCERWKSYNMLFTITYCKISEFVVKTERFIACVVLLYLVKI